MKKKGERKEKKKKKRDGGGGKGSDLARGKRLPVPNIPWDE